MNKENQVLYKVVMGRLDQLKINPDENLGQHFLINQTSIDLIAGCVIEGNTVIEVGAGVGQLTEALAERATQVISIEIDNRYKPILTQIVHKHSNIKMIFGDALSMDFQKYIPAQIISSLPYHITEPFLHKIAGLGIQNAILVVGDKLGRSIQALDERDEDFSQRTLLVKTFFNVELLENITKKVFFPVPRTNSVIVKLIPRTMDEIKRSKRDLVLRRLFLTSSRSPLVKNSIKEAVMEYSTIQITQNQSRQIIEGLNIPQSILDKPFDQLNNKQLGELSLKLRLLDVI